MAVTFKMVKVSDYPFQALKSARKVFEKETMGAMWKAVLSLRHAITKRTPYGAGPTHLRDSILADVQGTPVNLRGIVQTSMLYGEPVEHGTKPHMPPYGPIHWWVMKKLMPPYSETKRVTNAIRWKIYKKGTEGAHMFEEGWEATQTKINACFEAAAGRIRRFLEGS